MSEDAQSISSSDDESAKSISDEVSTKSKNSVKSASDEASAKSISDQISTKSISDSDGELFDAPNGKANGTDKGELEDGELETDSEGEVSNTVESRKTNERPRIVALPDTSSASRVVGAEKATGICKFFQRGSCTWGDNCKYKHIKVNFNTSNSISNAFRIQPGEIIAPSTTATIKQLLIL
jgi:hypothetical protein